MPKSAPSGRASGNVDLMVGMLPIQVTLYAGTVSDHGIKRSSYVPVEDGEDHPAGQKYYDKETGEDVEYAQLVRKIQTEYGPVYVEDSEIEKLFDINPDTVVVKTFQPVHLFRQGHYVPKNLMYVEPRKTGSGAKKGPSKTAVKSLNTLFEAMRDKGVCAVVEVTTRGTPKPAILLPDATLWYVYHTDALREQRELPEHEVADGDLAMMGMLIDTMHSTEPVDLTDKRSELIQDFADKKAAAGDFGKPAEVTVTKRDEPETDMMALLQASLAAAQKEAS